MIIEMEIDHAHIVLLPLLIIVFPDHLDMESIDALAKAVNEFEGGMVLVSHDMRLISQVAKEIWICDNKTIEKYKGDILNFKMDMRAHMGLETKLKGDASVKATGKPKPASHPKKEEPKLEVVKPAPVIASISEEPPRSVTPPSTLLSESEPEAAGPSTKKVFPQPHSQSSDDATASTSASSSAGSSSAPAKGRYIPPHLRKKMAEEGKL